MVVDVSQIIERANTLKYSSFNYVDEEDISVVDRECYYELPGCIFTYKVEEDRTQIFWAAESKDIFIKNLGQVISDIVAKYLTPDTIYMEFIPPEFVEDIEVMGFKVCSEFVDYWNYDLRIIDKKSNAICRVRRINPWEYDSAAYVTVSCRDCSRGFKGETSDFVREWDEEENSCILVAEIKETIVGAAFLNIYGFESKKGPVLWLRELAVEPEYQSMGIGRHLVGESIKWGIKNGAVRSFLACDTENHNAIRLYEDYGYKRNSERGQINMSLIRK